jgi:AcrR family transcriptional regulator
LTDAGRVTLGLRERKKAATRSSLSSAALALAAERGVDAVTVDEIAATAGVSSRTFFNYFATKEEAFVAQDLALAQNLLDRLRAEPPDAPLWSTLVRLLGDHLDGAGTVTPAQALAEHAVRSHPSVLTQQFRQYAGLEADLVAEIARRTGTEARSLEPRLLAAALVAAMRTALQAWLDAGAVGSPRALFQLAADRLSLAFPPDPRT